MPHFTIVEGGLDLVSAFNWSKCQDDGSIPPSTSGIFGATGEGNNLVAGVLTCLTADLVAVISIKISPSGRLPYGIHQT